MAFIYGTPRLIVQGCVEQTTYNAATGDVLAYDKVSNEAGSEYTYDVNELAGGFQNQLVGVIPHTTRMTGTYTSVAFSLIQRALQTGGNLKYNGIRKVCEEITATGNTLTVTGNPALYYAQSSSDTEGWCYVHEKGATSYEGINYGVNLTSKTVVDFTAESGKTYEVTYWERAASAQELGIPTAANPSIVTIVQKWAVYAPSGNNVKGSPLAGFLYLTVPRAILTEGGGIDGSQTDSSTTSYGWRALSPTEDLPECDNCAGGESNYAYYNYVPCGDATQDVYRLVTVGGGITLAEGESAYFPVKYLMPDGSTVQPDLSDMTYTIVPSGVATVGTDGKITGVEAASAVATATLTREGLPTLTTTCNVTVTA